MQTLKQACGDYINYLDRQSPIVSTSHHYLRGLYDAYGKAAVDAEVDRQFNNDNNALNFIIETTDNLLGN